MQKILFVGNENPIKADVIILADNLVQIRGELEKNISGFQLLDEDNNVFGRYEGYTTLYKEIEGGFVLSNDGSVYVEPEPEPEPTEPTLEEVQEAKVFEMSTAKQEAIQRGVNVTLSDATVKHFPLTEDDQSELLGLQSRVLTGEDNIPWHTSDEAEHCEFYSNADMSLIISTALKYVTWHKTYFRDLRIYIRSLENKETIESVTYGMDIPSQYCSDPLKAMIKERIS